ncbi:MAG: phosphate ABC transporter substrate-binding protein [Candidatus Omnitrophica bacterium]|nr:phosphate ABC transporter substrate-binding protein [Candidatus Omnitrophota bacterium]
MKNIITTVLAGMLLVGISGPVFSAEIKAQGSDTTISLVKALAEEYQKGGGDMIDIEGGGTAAGIKACAAGTVQFAFTTRKMKDDEASQGIVAVPYGLDGLAVVVNKNNAQEDIKIADLKAIYTGTKTTWDNGNPLIAFNVTPELAARELFKDKVLGKEADFAANIAVKHPGAMIPALAKIPNAIGYMAAGEVSSSPDIKALKIDGVAPAESTIRDGSYPMTRTLFIATKGAPSAEVQKFIDFVIGEKGQQVVKERGYVAIK